jgi:hypothetical protein
MYSSGTHGRKYRNFMVKYKYMDEKLPDYFKPILWSYDLDRLNLEKSKKTVIVNVINYGDLKHWSWLKENYGEEVVRKVLARIRASEIRPGARRLASIIFDISRFNYAPRGTN